MKVMSFNINGLRARPHQLEEIIKKYQPDVLGLQEIKVADEVFPYELVDHLGYHINHFGQKGHYGVALLSKQAPLLVRKGFPTDDEEAQKRIIMIDLDTPFGQLTVINGYFPQGESREHPTKFPAKQKFYADLHSEQCTQKQMINSHGLITAQKDLMIIAVYALTTFWQIKRWQRIVWIPGLRLIFVPWTSHQITHRFGRSLNNAVKKS